VTLCNLVAGFAAIHFAAKPIEDIGIERLSSLTLAGLLVFVGMLFDAVDGAVARLVRGSSELGVQLDSLADMVTFGVAPAFMMLRLVSHYLGPEGTTILGPDADNTFGRVVWAIAAIYIGCTALRLARYNAETPTSAVAKHMVFKGMPSPGAAGTVTSLIILHQHLLFVRGVSVDEVSQAFARWTAFGMPIVTLLCAFGMVSTIPYVHFTNRYIGGRRNLFTVMRLVVLVLCAIGWFQETAAVIFTWYAAWNPLRFLFQRARRRLGPRSGRSEAIPTSQSSTSG
jgi:CDP-diacylglycerol--serine O-phosphatidyltransferase